MSELTPVIIITGLVWFVAQSGKFLLARARGQRVHFMETGGMPSGHAAFVTAMTTVVALRDGLDSTTFGIALVLTAIVLHDAIRVRWSVGQQAERINELVDKAGLPKGERVVVWHGHRIREIAVGSLIGVSLSVIFHSVLY